VCPGIFKLSCNDNSFHHMKLLGRLTFYCIM
jgi:hypothetical protein